MVTSSLQSTCANGVQQTMDPLPMWYEPFEDSNVDVENTPFMR